MRDFFQPLWIVPKKKLLIYIIVFLLGGIAMNWIGQVLEIAKFKHWWQIITCYVLYMVPVSIVFQKYSFINQYCYGLFFMGLLEFGGYALESSYVYPDNFLIQWFGPYTFALTMTLFLSTYFPLGNWVVQRIYNVFNR